MASWCMELFNILLSRFQEKLLMSFFIFSKSLKPQQYIVEVAVGKCSSDTIFYSIIEGATHNPIPVFAYHFEWLRFPSSIRLKSHP